MFLSRPDAAKNGRSSLEPVRVFLDWLPMLVALVLYGQSRSIADLLGMPVQVGSVVDVEQSLFGGVLPTVWLQTQLLEESIRWWDVGIAVVYLTHFIVPWLVAAVFYLYSRPRWVSYIRRVLLLLYAGLLTYILLPAAPPWYAAADGHIADPVHRLAGRGWAELGLGRADPWLSAAQGEVNVVAALPSLHAAFALLVTVTLWHLLRHPVLRTCLVLLPLSMGFTLVYGGEHYVVDVLLGWFYVAIVLWVTRWWERRTSRRSMSCAATGKSTSEESTTLPK